jgi:hypothetical protein
VSWNILVLFYILLRIFWFYLFLSVFFHQCFTNIFNLITLLIRRTSGRIVGNVKYINVHAHCHTLWFFRQLKRDAKFTGIERKSMKPKIQWQNTPHLITILNRILVNPLNTELNPIRHLLSLAGAHHFVES